MLAALPPGKEPSVLTAQEDWVDFKAGLDILEKIIFSCPCRESKHEPAAIQPVAKSLYRLRYHRSTLTSAAKDNLIITSRVLFTLHLWIVQLIIISITKLPAVDAQ